MLTSLKEKKWIIFIVLGVISVAGLMIYWNASSNIGSKQTTEWSIPSDVDVETEPKEEALEEAATKEGKTLSTKMVDVKGAVSSPGVYKLNDEDRVIDVIEKAGGLTEEADQSKVNLAMKVEDEMVVYVPKIGEEMEMEGAITTSAQTQTPDKEGKKVNLNTATLDELQTLPGIGPSKAQAILDYREQIGQYKTVEELKEVTGIGDKTFEKLQTSIMVN